MDRGGGAEHITNSLDRGGSAEHMADILRRSDHAQDFHVRNGRGRPLSLGRRGKAFSYGTGAGGRSHLAKLRDDTRHCNSVLCLSFLLQILSGAAKAPWRPAPERIRSKNERLSAQSFTRRYEMVRNTVTDRAPRAFKEQALGSRRAERASPEKADHSEQANQTPSKGGVRVAFFPVHEEDL